MSVAKFGLEYEIGLETLREGVGYVGRCTDSDIENRASYFASRIGFTTCVLNADLVFEWSNKMMTAACG